MVIWSCAVTVLSPFAVCYHVQLGLFNKRTGRLLVDPDILDPIIDRRHQTCKCVVHEVVVERLN